MKCRVVRVFEKAKSDVSKSSVLQQLWQDTVN
jgi:hypothetical protein